MTAKDETQTKTTTTSEDANGVKTETVNEVVTETDLFTDPAPAPTVRTTEEETVTVTAPNAAIAGLLSGIEAPDSFAAGTVITIVRKSADDDGELKLETVYVKTEL